jgi:hypothetical protein
MAHTQGVKGPGKSWIQPGLEYAFREKRVPRAKLERVRVLERVRKTKWKAEWIEPNPGLVHYVDSRQLVSTWKDHKSFLKLEDQELTLKEESARTGYRKDSPVDRALYEVFDNIGDDLGYYNGILSCQPDALPRFKARIAAGSHQESRYGYVGNDGKLHLPYGDAVALAQAFCAAEPSTVLTAIEATERQWAQKARRPGEERPPADLPGPPGNAKAFIARRLAESIAGSRDRVDLVQFHLIVRVRRLRRRVSADGTKHFRNWGPVRSSALRAWRWQLPARGSS